ncbi:MAG TPA: sensor domain-containing diguanylate cyclase [Mycobacteriales bacterium]|nr:sensor domain-containing diguanylate cyclase [Mycobacteriales bacterium]
MDVAPLPDDEQLRLNALRRYGILDSEPEIAFDDVAALASQLAGTPIALVSLVDEGRQWFKARLGLDVGETPRDIAFCAHAILEPDDVFVVPSARDDERFSDNPLVTGDPHIQFYAGAPLVTPDGHALGTVCVLDTQPRTLSAPERDGLQRLARTVIAHFEARRVAHALLSVTDVLEELRAAQTRTSLHEVANDLVKLMDRVVGADGAALLVTSADLGSAPVLAAHEGTGPPAELPAAFLANITRRATLIFEPDAGWSPAARSVVLLPLVRGARTVGLLAAWWAAPVERLEPTVTRVLEVLGHEAAYMLARQRSVESLTIEAHTDALTGLANRRSGDALLDELPSVATIALVDLDYFKQLNDTHGHAAGDAALRDFAAAVRAAARASDVACRWGGEEFMLAFPQARADEGLRVLGRIRQLLAVTQPGLTFSAGIAERQPGTPVWVTLAAADESLYAAKAQGRDRDVVARPA